MGGFQFTKNIYIQNSEELNFSIHTYVHTCKYSIKLEGEFWISPQVFKKKLLAVCIYICFLHLYALKDTTFELDNWHPMRNFCKWTLLTAVATHTQPTAF